MKSYKILQEFMIFRTCGEREKVIELPDGDILTTDTEIENLFSGKHEQFYKNTTYELGYLLSDKDIEVLLEHKYIKEVSDDISLY